MHVVVVGAGVSGLGASLALARRGHRVTVLERDVQGPPAEPSAAFADWHRPGVPHFRLPHLVLGLGRALLAREFPDVLETLAAAGAADLFFRDRVPGGPGPEDADLVALACRRPLFEWGFRTVAERAPNVTIRTGVRAEGLAATGSRITGVRTQDDHTIEADLIIDASGRGSRIGAWLAELGLPEPAEDADPCGLMYYSRYFRPDPSFTYPTRQSLFGPRGDLGYMGFATFPGEHGSWCLALSLPPWDADLRAIRQQAAFMAAGRSIPAVLPMIDASVPTTPVLLMGELRNRTRSLVVDGEPVATGVVTIGDALTQTDPSFGWGLSIGLQQAVRLAELAGAADGDARALARAFESDVAAWSASYYRASRDMDRGRTRWWRGEVTPAEAYAIGGPLFPAALAFAGRSDPEIYRAATRRNNLLDPVDQLMADRPLLERAAALFAEQRRTAPPPPPAGPDRAAMLDIVREAATD